MMKGLSRLLAILLFPLVLPVLGAPRRNIVVVIADDHGPDAGCYGNKVIKTPSLDRLASEGVRFTNAYCTTASCSASRSVLLSGLHNHLNGQYGHQHDYHNFHTKTTVRSLPVLLAEAGYRTGRIGKFHVQPEAVYHFETFCNQNKVASVIRWRWRRKRGSLLQPKMSGLSSCISALAIRIAAAGPPPASLINLTFSATTAAIQAFGK